MRGGDMVYTEGTATLVCCLFLAGMPSESMCVQLHVSMWVQLHVRMNYAAVQGCIGFHGVHCCHHKLKTFTKLLQQFHYQLGVL